MAVQVRPAAVKWLVLLFLYSWGYDSFVLGLQISSQQNILEYNHSGDINGDPIPRIMHTNNKQARKERRSAGLDLYKHLSKLSGGSVYVTDKRGVAKIVDVLKESATTSSTTILKTFPVSPQVIDVPVDTTVTNLTIKIIADTTPKGEPVNALTDPHGKTISMTSSGDITVKNLGGGVRLIKIKSPTSGVWKLEKKDSVPWSLEVSGQSPIDFSTKFVQTNPLNGFQYPITGSPVAGDKVSLIITVPSIEKAGGIDEAIFIDSNSGTTLTSTNLVQGRGRAESMFKGSCIIPYKAFQVMVTGTDKHGNRLQRFQKSITTPIAIKLKIGKLAGSLYINEDLIIPYTVENAGGTTAAIQVDITDDRGFTVKPTSRTVTLASRASSNGTFLLRAGGVAGVTTTVTVSAQPSGAGGHSPQYDTRRITVEEHINRTTDNSNPECNVTSVTGSCSLAQMDTCACHNYTWSGSATFGDVGLGLYTISSSIGTSGTFTYDNFTSGDTIDRGIKTAHISSDCCHPEVFITVVDMASNTGSCKFDLAKGLKKPVYPCTTPIPSTPSTSAPTTATAYTSSTSMMTTSPPITLKSNNSSLGTGAIVGICVGAVGAVAVTIGIAVLVSKKGLCRPSDINRVKGDKPALS